MIVKIGKKIISYLFIVIAVLGNTGWFSLLKMKEVRKETVGNNAEILSFEKPTPPLFYRNYIDSRILNGLSQSGEASFLVNTDSTTIAVTSFEYIADPAYITINDIQDISIDLAEPKSFLARNLNKEWKENIDFYSNSSAYPKKI